MSKTALYFITALLTIALLYTWLTYLPKRNAATSQENKELEAKNKELDSRLGQKQKILDSLAQTSVYWETKFFTQLADSSVKIKYVAIKEGVSGLSRDSSVLYFLERTK